MSQLASATKPARTARQLAKIRDINKVKTAIKWHERERAKRQALAEARWESKRTALERQAHVKKNIKDPIKEARRNLREDYKLGPLRPDRAVGHDAERYGALPARRLTRPEVPVKVQEAKNKAREAKGLEPEYPFVVDGKKYFHIAKGDRVMVMKGREQGKIGVIDEVAAASHDVTVKGLNKHYADGRLFSIVPGEKAEAQREVEVSIPIEDVRLVVPYRMTTIRADGSEKHTYQDVVVDEVLMERHTTGIDPFTNVDYGNRMFPEEHRFDPETGLPIFNRYIGGTRQRIYWPWESEIEEQVVEDTAGREEKLSLIGTVKQPIKSLKRLFKRGDNTGSSVSGESSRANELQPANIDMLIDGVEEPAVVPRFSPAQNAVDNEDDTGRNKAEPSEHTRSFAPTLVYPPFPNELAAELQSHKLDKDEAISDDKPTATEAQRDSSRKRTQRELRKLEQKIAMQDSMKTPLQLRWEVERAQKLHAEKVNPIVDREALMAALGQHIHVQRAAKQAAKQPSRSATELD